MSSKRRSKRRTWSREEVSLLLKCYNARKDEFQHSRKKIFGYRKVLDDMLQQGFPDSSLTVTAVEGKIKTLFLAYKTGKDSPSVALCMREMDEIFGNVTKNSTVDKPWGATSSRPITPVSFVKEENMSEDFNSLDSTFGRCSTFSPVHHSIVDESSHLLNTPRRSARKTKTDDTNVLASQKNKSELEQNFKIMFFEQMKTSLEEHFRIEEEILREAQKKKIKLLDSFLKRMENM